MTPRDHPFTVDLVGNHEVVRRRVEARAAAESVLLQSWSNYDDLLCGVCADESNVDRMVLVCAESASEIPLGFVRDCSRGHGRTRIVVIAPALTEAQARELVLEGAAGVHGVPLPGLPVREWFALESFLQMVYPGALECERTEIHRLRLPSSREWVAPTIRHLCQRFDSLGYPDEMVRSVFPLVIDESITNAMGHGHGWDESLDVEVEATLSPRGFRLVVQDQGRGFDRRDVRDPLASENLRREGGRGLFLMETLVDDVHYEDGGRRVVLAGGEFVQQVVEVG